MLNDEEIKSALEKSPERRVTKEGMESRIASKEFIRIGETVTVCHLTLDNGYSVRGESACVNPANYNKEIGERIAFDNAFRQLWPLFPIFFVSTLDPRYINLERILILK